MESRKQHFDRNAKEGRSVRFALTLNTQHVPEDVAKAIGLSRISTKITGGTMTPEQAKRLFDLLAETMR